MPDLRGFWLCHNVPRLCRNASRVCRVLPRPFGRAGTLKL